MILLNSSTWILCRTLALKLPSLSLFFYSNYYSTWINTFGEESTKTTENMRRRRWHHSVRKGEPIRQQRYFDYTSATFTPERHLPICPHIFDTIHHTF